MLAFNLALDNDSIRIIYEELRQTWTSNSWGARAKHKIFWDHTLLKIGDTHYFQMFTKVKGSFQKP